MKKTIIIAFLSFLAGIAFCFVYDNNSTEAEPINEVQEINEDTIVVDAKTHCLQQMEKALAGDTIIKSVTGKVKKRNSLMFFVNMDRRIMITEGDRVPYEIAPTDIKYLIKKFLRNSDNEIRFPEYVEMDLPRLGRRSVITRDYYICVEYRPLREENMTRMPIDTLINDAPFYVEPIFMAINELRNEFAWKEFHKSFEDCDSVEKEVCITAYPCKIHDGFYYEWKFIPSPPEIRKLIDVDIVENDIEISEGRIVFVFFNNPESKVAARQMSQSVEWPEFPGGMRALMKYLHENINYPQISRDNNSQGRAFVSFIVNADGSIKDVKVLESSGDIYLDKEAVRVVSNMPQWSPGKARDCNIRIDIKLPIVFRLQ